MNTIRFIRKRIGATQEEFAEAAGVAQPTVSRWEASDQKGGPTPSAAEIQRICAKFPKIKPADFFNPPQAAE